jgi:hypothetical protein
MIGDLARRRTVVVLVKHANSRTAKVGKRRSMQTVMPSIPTRASIVFR